MSCAKWSPVINPEPLHWNVNLFTAAVSFFYHKEVSSFSEDAHDKSLWSLSEDETLSAGLPSLLEEIVKNYVDNYGI